MKVAVLGAGAVGSYLGGILAGAGHEVVLIGREAHVEAVNAAGLRISRADGEEVAHPAASTEGSAVADADVVLCCVKSPDTPQAAADLRPHLREGAVVVSVQNGIGNAEVLAEALPQATVLASVVYVAVGLAEPGHVVHRGAGTLVLSAGPDQQRLSELFEGTGFEVEGVADVRVALWTKLTANCVWNPLSAIADLSYGELWDVPGMPEVVQDVAKECLAVGRAEGVDLPDSLLEDVARLAQTMPTQVSSTAMDLRRGRRTEIDHLTGEVTRLGARHGIETPACRLLTALVHAKEPRPES